MYFYGFVRTVLTTSTLLGNLSPPISLAQASSFASDWLPWLFPTGGLGHLNETSGFFLLRSLCLSKPSSWVGSKSNPHCLTLSNLSSVGVNYFPTIIPTLYSGHFCQPWPFRFLKHEADTSPWCSQTAGDILSSLRSLPEVLLPISQ